MFHLCFWWWWSHIQLFLPGTSVFPPFQNVGFHSPIHIQHYSCTMQEKQLQKHERRNNNVEVKRSRGEGEQLSLCCVGSLFLLVGYPAQSSASQSTDIWCVLQMDQQRCISDAQMFQLGFASYPAISQNPDADHSQMLQKERNCSIHCK